MDKKKVQALADAYGAGQIKQGQIAGEYPPPEVLPNYLTDPTPEQAERARKAGAGIAYSGTVTGRFSSTVPNVTEQEPSPTGRIRRTKLDFWPLAYIGGPRKLSEALAERPSSVGSDALAHADYSKLEERVAAWHADLIETNGDEPERKHHEDSSRSRPRPDDAHHGHDDDQT